MANIIPSLDRLIDQFAAIGGVGRKTAARYAYHVLSLSDQEAADFAAAILDAHKNVHRCPICQNLTDGSICSICANEARDRSIICVVQSPQDVNAFEKTFALVRVVTAGGPNHASEVMTTYLYDQAFKFGHYGYGSAIGVILFAVIALMSLLVMKLTKREAYEY